jgi:predicted lactoylglutathione lyase
MNEKELLKNLIDKPKQPSISEWVYEVEAFLENTGELNREAERLIYGIKTQGEKFNRCGNLTALLRQLYKRKYDGIVIPPIKKRNQIFVAMMFNDEMDAIYQNVYKLTIQSHNFSALLIDEKQYNGSIIGEITTEINDSIALIADLTGNRGGVYYEAGVARGLQLCNHPIQLIFTCSKDFFDTDGVHFDVKGDNIIIYSTEDNLKQRLSDRIKSVYIKADKTND